jgi:NAD(P)-dependent dehydrogenase (short-subunit alcohol dehydrogenase family)
MHMGEFEMQMPEILEGKRVVITGAGQGLGAATAEVCAEAGAALVLLDINADTVAEVAEGLRAKGHTVHSTACDISDETSVKSAAAFATERLGRIDGLVNNAGVVGFMPLEEMTLEEWNRLVKVNLTGPFLCLRYLGSTMIPNKSGAIVTVTSTAASIPQSKSGAYSPTKAGAKILARQAATEWGEHGIRSNVVAPGAMWTPMTKPFQSDPEAVARRSNIIASKRISEPREVAQVICFLLSDLASYINGANIDVDGGLRQMMLSLMPRPGVNKY